MFCQTSKRHFLYNDALKQSRETDFLHYYKILEYFYLVNCDDKSLKERFMLKKLLSNLVFKNQIEKMIHKNELNLSIASLAEKIYAYRNTIVHTKEENQFVLDLLKYPDEFKADYQLSSIVKNIALLCINYFCYDNKLPIMNECLES